MKATEVPMAPATAPPAASLGLHTGDRLTREEFHRRYEASPHVRKAELVEGVVYMPSPIRHRSQGQPHFNLIGWLAGYVTHTPGVEGGLWLDAGALLAGDLFRVQEVLRLGIQTSAHADFVTRLTERRSSNS